MIKDSWNLYKGIVPATEESHLCVLMDRCNIRQGFMNPGHQVGMSPKLSRIIIWGFHGSNYEYCLPKCDVVQSG